MKQPDNPPIRQDRAKLYQYAKGHAFKDKQASDVFEEIFKSRSWDEQEPEESASGPGSSRSQTKVIVQELPTLFTTYHIQHVLDVPCGDFNWMQRINWEGKKYTGADIVPSLIQQNRLQYASEHLDFVTLNLLEDDLPSVDLIFCRDCLVHFSYADIEKAIGNIKKSKSTYLLTTTFPEQTLHEDIDTGGWRPINLQQAPFSFPNPLYLLNEQCTEMQGAFRDKSLGLWKIADI